MMYPNTEGGIGDKANNRRKNNTEIKIGVFRYQSPVDRCAFQSLRVWSCSYKFPSCRCGFSFLFVVCKAGKRTDGRERMRAAN